MQTQKFKITYWRPHPNSNKDVAFSEGSNQKKRFKSGKKTTTNVSSSNSAWNFLDPIEPL
jgi:hypothetical protein